MKTNTTFAWWLTVLLAIAALWFFIYNNESPHSYFMFGLTVICSLVAFCKSIAEID